MRRERLGYLTFPDHIGTAGEDQTEAIVLDLLISGLFTSARTVIDARFHMDNKISLCPSKRAHRRITSMALKNAVEINQWAWLVRNTSLRPEFQSGGECLMHGFFGEIQISEEAHQRRQNLTDSDR
jgi:hypothetical protein